MAGAKGTGESGPLTVGPGHPELVEKKHVLAGIAAEVRSCRMCEGLNIPSITQAAPGYGNPESPVVLVGQSLCGPCMSTQVPFTGGSGKLMDAAFRAARVAKADVFLTNIVHCHPPDNRPSRPHEIRNCTPFLLRELEAVLPCTVIALGNDAARTLSTYIPMGYDIEDTWLPALDRRTVVMLRARHPAYIMRRNRAERMAYVTTLADAIRCAFRYRAVRNSDTGTSQSTDGLGLAGVGNRERHAR